MGSGQSPDSWRFEESLGWLPHVALYVRDSLQLSVAVRPTVPPHLTSGVPDLRGLVPPDVRSKAGALWTAWWESLVGVGKDLQPPAPIIPQSHPLLASPDWESLADRPALQQAVAATFEDGLRFAQDLKRSLLLTRPPPPGFFSQRAIGQAAEAVAAWAGVPSGSLRASATILDVQGLWWMVAGRGELLCSAQSAGSADANEALVAVFRSAIRR